MRADRAVLHVLISIDISHRVFSHASTEVSRVFIFFHMYYFVYEAPATVCDVCLSNNTGLSDRMGEGKDICHPQHRSGAWKESKAWYSTTGSLSYVFGSVDMHSTGP